MSPKKRDRKRRMRLIELIFTSAWCRKVSDFVISTVLFRNAK